MINIICILGALGCFVGMMFQGLVYKNLELIFFYRYLASAFLALIMVTRIKENRKKWALCLFSMSLLLLGILFVIPKQYEFIIETLAPMFALAALARWVIKT